MQTFSSLRVTLMIIASAIFWAIVLCCLPTNAYQRWQTLKGTEYDNLQTIYERVHYDPRPLDVVIVGPSKAAIDLSIKRIRSDLAAAGLHVNAFNLSVLAAGRNKDYAVVKEMYKTKAPKVMVVGVDTIPYPYGHPIFKYFADTSDIVVPPAPGLHEYPYDFAYLPFRQLKLFVANLLPDALGLTKTFDPVGYAVREAHDFSEGFWLNGQWIDTRRHATPAIFAKDPYSPRQPGWLIRQLNRFNHGEENTYMLELIKLAQAHGTKLIFVYLPEYGAPPQTTQAAFYQKYGQLLSLGEMASRPELYMEAHHANRDGARMASDRVAAAIVATLKGAPTPPTVPAQQ